MLGEHSDWAVGDFPLSPAREKGWTLIARTNQEIYAEVKQHHTHLIVRAGLNDGIRDLQLNITPFILEG
ncbi:hypothetical protein [Microcoleus sp. D2_18a_D3]|uniref:hypothetical protein n=1 Tax=Microcoleus sp. D2_18a_D3 TaxID=3055330 RepID=UPI002FD26E46